MLGRGLESLIPASGAGNSVGGGDDKPVQQPTVLPTVAAPAFQGLEGASVQMTAVSAPASEPEKTEPEGEVTSIDSEVGGSALDFQNRDYHRENFATKPNQEAVFQLEADRILPNPYQPRKEFNEEELRELAQSIREYGIIQPLVVSKVEEETETGTSVRYQLIAGERRLRAAKMVGLERVPAIIRKVDTKKLNLELAIIENVQRSNLNPLDEAKAYARLQDEFNLTQREIATRVGKSRESVANNLRLLSLPSFIQDALTDGKINESQARVLLSVADLQAQKKMFVQLVEQGMSVRQLRRTVSGAPDPEKNYLERQLEERLGAPVEIKKRGDKGKLVIKFFSNDEMKGVLQRLLGEYE